MGEKTESLSKIIILSVVVSLLLFTKANAAILFEDDFNDGVADGWNEFRGIWSVISGVYVTERGDNENSIAFTGDYNWTNYSYEARIMMNPGDNDFGLIFYAQSVNEYLRFTIWGEEGKETPRISHMVYDPSDDDFNSVGEYANVVLYPDLVNGKWYDVKLVLRNNSIFAYVDDELVAYSDNLPFDHGAIGLTSDSHELETYFDDVKVTENLLVEDLLGTWGYVVLEHRNDSWGSTGGTSTLKSDGKGIDQYCSNDEGNPHCKTKDFTYSATANQDGSITYTQAYDDGIQILKYILSDDKKIAIADTTSDTTEQVITLSIKMDPLKTCTDEDLSGEYYGIGYDFLVELPQYYYSSQSLIGSFDASGGFDFYGTWNTDEGMVPYSGTRTYSVNDHCSFSMQTNYDSIGYLSGDLNRVVLTSPTLSNDWKIVFLMRKQDRTYSTADLAGTWAFVSFGDEENGSRFNSEFGLLTCDKVGNCTFSTKVNTDDNIKYQNSGNHQLVVSADGSVSDSTNLNAPSYAAAIGNNGNTIISNIRSFREGELWDREIMIGVRCSDCWNLAEQRIPLLTFNPSQFTGGGNGLNIYLYNPTSDSVETVKENTYDSWFPSINSEQTKIAYTEGTKGGCYTIKVCDIPALTCNSINTVTVKRAAYFDDDGKIVFIDCADGKLKKMDSDGNNITPLSSTEYLYDDVFCMSPDRDLIAVTMTRREGSYHTTNYQKIVLLDTDGNVKCSTPEYLGDWNNLYWKPDSNGFFYYYHQFNVIGGVFQEEIPKYELINLDCSVTDLSNTDLGRDKSGQPREENPCFFTKTGNLLSVTYQELYNGATGALIMDVSSIIPDCSPAPCIPNSMYGLDPSFNGDIFFADSDGSNFRRFIEKIGGDLSEDGSVDISDVILDLRIALGLDTIKSCSDVNNDGNVDISDVILILRIALGIDPMKPCT